MELKVTEEKRQNSKGKSLRKLSKAQTEEVFSYTDYELKRAYSSMLPLTKAKKKDLMKMCTEKIIPIELHPWYQSLPDKEGVDYLPEGEEDDDDYTEV